MLHKCANPSCQRPFRNLMLGRLFQVETGHLLPTEQRALGSRRKHSERSVEHFWLCDECSGLLTLIYNQGYGIELVPFANARKPPRAVQLVAFASVAKDGRSQPRSGTTGTI